MENPAFEILEHFNGGACIVNVDGYMQGRPSHWLKRIFPELAQNGQASLLELFKTHSTLTAENLAVLSSALMVIIGQDDFNFSLNKRTLIRSATINLKSGGQVDLDLEWLPIIKDDLVDNLLLVMSDGTALKIMKATSERNALEIAILNEVMEVNANTLAEFLKSSAHYITSIRARIKFEDNVVSGDNLTYVRRIMHTIKENSRSAKLLKLSSMIHDLELLLDSNPTTATVIECCERINKSLQLYVEWQGKIIQRAVEAVTEDSEVPQTLHHLFVEVVKNHGEMAEECGITSLTAIALKFGNFQFQPHIWGCLRETLIHIIRNSIDHGLRDYMSVAELTIDAEMLTDSMVLKYQDPGRGLDLNRIKFAANRRGIEPRSNEPIDIANMIFSEGVTTKELVSEISGRGSGMGAMRDLLRAIGGTVEIELLNEKSPNMWAFKIEIRLPLS